MPDRSRGERLIDWTGERCVPWADDLQMVYEHLHRYLFAAQFAKGCTVLDLGSGEGYGSSMLASTAISVTGIEIDEAAVEHARRRYPLANLEFHQGSVLELGRFGDRSFDLIVCFELIEHVTEHEELLAGVGRILRDDGLFVVSTPDREVYSEAHDYHNPYHLKELSREEFDQVLHEHFPQVAMWTQSGVVRSIMRSIGLVEQPKLVEQDFGVDRVDGDHWERTDDALPPYIVAVASRTSLPPVPTLSVLSSSLASQAPPLPAGVIDNSLLELWDDERLRRQVRIYEAALVDAAAARQRAEAASASAAQDVALLHEDIVRQHGEEDRLHRAVADLAGELASIKGSRAWGVLTRYRRIRHLLSARLHRPSSR